MVRLDSESILEANISSSTYLDGGAKVNTKKAARLFFSFTHVIRLQIWAAIVFNHGAPNWE